MWRRALPIVATMAVMAACASPGATVPIEPDALASASSRGEAGDLYPGFDFERVTQLEAGELPDGIPVPVPAGGTINESVGAFEGELLAIDYDPRYFQTAVAFYGTWLAREGIDASPLFGAGADAAGWAFSVGDVPVRIEISRTADASSTNVSIFWG